MRMSCSVRLCTMIFLVFSSFTAASDSVAITVGQGDSPAAESRLDTVFARKAGVGYALSITGLSLTIAGEVLPWLMANPRNAGGAATFLVTGLGLVTGGSTMAGIGTTVIRKWATDHIKDPPETRAWTTYKIGMAMTYIGAIFIGLGVGSGNLATLVEYGIPVYLAGETFFLISSIQSVVYTSSVNSKRKNKEFELIALPTIDLRGGAGCVLVLSLF